MPRAQLLPATSMPSACQNLSQIADQGAADRIRKHKPVNDPVLVAVRDPSDQPNDAVNAFDVDACGEYIVDDYRFCQWGVFIHHRFSGVRSEILEAAK